MSEITIVTAFFNIGRGNLPQTIHGRRIPEYQHRDVDKYFEYFNNLAKIKNDMVVYTTKEFKDRVIEARMSHGNNNTEVVILDSYLIDKTYNPKDLIQSVMDSKDFISKVRDPEKIEYWNADYILVNLFKSFYVLDAINSGYTKNELVAWIDFGYCRSDTTIPFDEVWSYQFDKDKIHIFNMEDIDKKRSIESIVYSGDVYIQGCHIVAGKDQWGVLKDLMTSSFDSLIRRGLSDDDQTILLMSYLSSPDNFILRNNSKSDWFRIFKDYKQEIKNV
jgi:protein YibB